MKAFHDPELAKATPTELPARILLQVRDGIPNLLQEGTIESFRQEKPSAKDAAAGAKVTHSIEKSGVVDLVARALAAEIEEWLKIAPAEHHPKIKDWLRTRRTAIFGALD